MVEMNLQIPSHPKTGKEKILSFQFLLLYSCGSFCCPEYISFNINYILKAMIFSK